MRKGSAALEFILAAALIGGSFLWAMVVLKRSMEETRSNFEDFQRERRSFLK